MEYTLIENFEDIKELNLENNAQYLCLIECYNGHKNVWKAIVANFYTVGDIVNLVDTNNTVHKYTVHENGFYFLSPIPRPGVSNFIKVNEVRWYKKIDFPVTDPDSFFTIEK